MIANMKDKLNHLFTEALPFIPAIAVAVILSALIFWMEADRSKRLSARSQQTQRVVYVYVKNPSTPANDQAVNYRTKLNTPAKRNLRMATFNRLRRASHRR